MRPVFEEQSILLQEMLEILRSIGLIARKEDLMMRPLDPLDAVDLNEAQIMDQIIEPLTPERLGRRARQALPFEEDFACESIGDGNRHGMRLGHVRDLFNKGKSTVVESGDTKRSQGLFRCTDTQSGTVISVGL